MTSRRFSALVAALVLLMVVPFVAYNYVRDDFGLFGSTGEKPWFVREKTSKQLLSYRYVPENFEGLLMGPSYSDTPMDTRVFEGYRIYNMSMNGANATTLKEVSAKALEQKMRFIIICLSPYLTKDSGLKDSEVSPKNYWGSLFSFLPVEVWRARRDAEKANQLEVYQVSAWGMDPLVTRPSLSWQGFIDRQRTDNPGYAAELDPVALQHLGEIVRTAHANGTQVFAYFYPYDRWLAESGKPEDFERFRQSVTALFDPAKDVVWDMTAQQYDPMRNDPNCYTNSHLSEAGGRLVMRDIQRQLDKHYMGLDRPFPIEPGERYACFGKPGAGSGTDGPPPG